MGSEGCVCLCLSLLVVHGNPGRAVSEAKAVIASFQNMTVMGESIKQRRGQFGISKHASPLAKAQVGGDDHAGFLI